LRPCRLRSLAATCRRALQRNAPVRWLSLILPDRTLTDLISKRTRQAVREYFVGTTLGIISDAFDAADIRCDSDYSPPVGGQRRALVEQYYHSINWGFLADARKFVSLVQGVIADLDAWTERPDSAAFAREHRTKLVRAMATDGWEFDGSRFDLKAGKHHLAQLSASAAKLNAPELDRQLSRMRESVEADPALAVGTAKEIIETACKTILEEHGREPNSDWDVGRLVKETREVLKLLPSDIPEGAKGAETIKRILSNLGAVTQGLAELRNLYGTGHGRSAKRTRGIEARHARLASGAAAALVTFFLETHWERSADDANESA
jgi:hypothetical protein